MKFTVLAVMAFVAVAVAADAAAAPAAAAAAAPAAGAAGAAAPNAIIGPPGFRPAFLRCVVNVEVSSNTIPGIGNEAWWGQNYATMQQFFEICSTAETRNSFQLRTGGPLGNEAVKFAIPDGPVVFQLDVNKVPYAFIPFYETDTQNLPGGRFAGMLQCYKTWTHQNIEVKACEPVSVNHL